MDAWEGSVVEIVLHGESDCKIALIAGNVIEEETVGEIMEGVCAGDIHVHMLAGVNVGNLPVGVSVGDVSALVGVGNVPIGVSAGGDVLAEMDWGDVGKIVAGE